MLEIEKTHARNGNHFTRANLMIFRFWRSERSNKAFSRSLNLSFMRRGAGPAASGIGNFDYHGEIRLIQISQHDMKVAVVFCLKSYQPTREPPYLALDSSRSLIR
jgi:hypothetical protein